MLSIKVKKGQPIVVKVKKSDVDDNREIFAQFAGLTQALAQGTVRTLEMVDKEDKKFIINTSLKMADYLKEMTCKYLVEEGYLDQEQADEILSDK